MVKITHFTSRIETLDVSQVKRDSLKPIVNNFNTVPQDENVQILKFLKKQDVFVKHKCPR